MKKIVSIQIFNAFKRKMKNPLVSIILPTYNGKSERLSESIDSVLNQTFKDFELLIINDCSTNDIEKTILKYKKQDSRIVYLKNEKNLQLTKTLNKGLEHAKGKYIARIDDDDIRLSNDKLEKQVGFMENNKEYGLCGAGKIIKIDEDGNERWSINTRYYDEEIRNHMLQSNQFVHSSILTRKSILDEVGVYNPDYNKAEDYELWCRIGMKSKFRNLQDISIKYRINSKGITQKNYFYQKKLTFKICLKYYKYYPKFLKALILRMGDFLLSEGMKNKILYFLK